MKININKYIINKVHRDIIIYYKKYYNILKLLNLIILYNYKLNKKH